MHQAIIDANFDVSRALKRSLVEICGGSMSEISGNAEARSGVCLSTELPYSRLDGLCWQAVLSVSLVWSPLFGNLYLLARRVRQGDSWEEKGRNMYHGQGHTLIQHKSASPVTWSRDMSTMDFPFTSSQFPQSSALK